MTKPFIRFHRIPIYDLRLWVAVGPSVVELKKKFAWAFGDDVEPAMGSCCYAGDKFAILLEDTFLSHELIAHEVLHLTNRMLDFCGHPFHSGAHEPHAYLCGYLTQIVYRDLVNAQIRIRLKMPQITARSTPQLLILK